MLEASAPLCTMCTMSNVASDALLILHDRPLLEGRSARATPPSSPPMSAFLSVSFRGDDHSPIIPYAFDLEHHQGDYSGSRSRAISIYPRRIPQERISNARPYTLLRFVQTSPRGCVRAWTVGDPVMAMGPWETGETAGITTTSARIRPKRISPTKRRSRFYKRRANAF